MPRRRITGGQIKFISLVRRGANQLPVLYKEEGDGFEFNPIVKDDLQERGELTAVVCAPEHRDSQGDTASADAIKELAYSFMKDGEGVDIRHDGKALPKGEAYVAESFIIQKGDPRFQGLKTYDGKPVDPTNGWATVIKIEDPALRAQYRQGLWNGVSMGGTGKVVVEKRSKRKVNSIVKALAALLGMNNPRAFGSINLSGDIDMDRAELIEVLKTNNTELAKSIGESVGKAVAAGIEAQQNAALEKSAGCKPDDSAEVKAARVTLFKANGGKAAETPAASPTATATTPAKVEKPIFKGDVAKAEDVAKFEAEVARYNILKDVDTSDPAQVRKANEELAKLEKPKDGATDLTAEEQAAGVTKEDDSEVRELRLKLHKAQRRSNQGGPGGTPTAPAAPTNGQNTPPPMQLSGVTLSKEDQDGLAAGNRMGAYLAESRGNNGSLLVHH